MSELGRLKFQSPLSRGTTPDPAMAVRMPKFYVFQSPLSRGTTPDLSETVWGLLVELEQVSIPSKSGHYSRRIEPTQLEFMEPSFQSPLSRGTTPDKVSREFGKLDVSMFQSPLSRGTTPDANYVCIDGGNTYCGMFQSPLSRGTTPDISPILNL